MMKKTWVWIGIFALVLAGGLGAYLLHGAPGRTAELWLDGKLYRTVDLTAVSEPYEFDVTSGRGTNTVRVSPGAIEVVWSDCPEQLCVQQGAIESSAIPITCLPHRLVIQIEDDR